MHHDQLYFFLESKLFINLIYLLYINLICSNVLIQPQILNNFLELKGLCANYSLKIDNKLSIFSNFCNIIILLIF